MRAPSSIGKLIVGWPFPALAKRAAGVPGKKLSYQAVLKCLRAEFLPPFRPAALWPVGSGSDRDLSMQLLCTQSLGDKAKDAYKDAKDTVKVSFDRSVRQLMLTNAVGCAE